jgi:hypothetical protein
LVPIAHAPFRINDSVLHVILACKLIGVYTEDGFSNEKYLYNILILSLLLKIAIADIVSNVRLNSE